APNGAKQIRPARWHIVERAIAPYVLCSVHPRPHRVVEVAEIFRWCSGFGRFLFRFYAMSDDVPFDKQFDLAPGVLDELTPGVRRLLANNPSPFTFTGTVSYIVGRGNVAIIDPGPDNEAHAAALLEAVRGETVTHILVTHTHRDHSPNTARLKAATGAPVYAEGPHRASRPYYES